MNVPSIHTQIKTIILDDHSAVSLGLKVTLENSNSFKIKNILTSADGLTEFLKHEPIDLIISDITMPGQNIFDVLRVVKKTYPDMKSMIYTMHEGEGYFRDALSLEVQAYILKEENLNHIPWKIKEAYHGSPYYSEKLRSFLHEYPIVFTEKEHEIIRLLLIGKSNKDISESLNKSKRTIEFHINNIKLKMNVSTISELIIKILKEYYN